MCSMTSWRATRWQRRCSATRCIGTVHSNGSWASVLVAAPGVPGARAGYSDRPLLCAGLQLHLHAQPDLDAFRETLAFVIVAPVSGSALREAV